MFEIQNVNYKNGTGSGLFTLLQYKIMNTVTGLLNPATGLYLGYYHETYYKGAHYAAIYPLSTASQNTNTWFFQADGSVNYKIINSNSELEGWNHLTFSDPHEGLSPGILPIEKDHPPATLHEESSSNLLWQIEEGANGYNIVNPTKGVDGYLNFAETAYYKGNHHFAEVRNKMLGSDWKVQLDMSSVSLEYKVTNIEFDNLKPEFFMKERIDETIFCNNRDETMTCHAEYFKDVVGCRTLHLDNKQKAGANIGISYKSSTREKLVVNGKLMGELNYAPHYFPDLDIPDESKPASVSKTITVPPNSCIKSVGYFTWFNYFVDKYYGLSQNICLWFPESMKLGLPFTGDAEVSAYADVLNQETGEVQKYVKIDNPEAIKHILLESYKEGDAPKISDMSGKDTISIQLSGKIAIRQFVHTEIQTDDVDCTTLSDADLHYCLRVTNQNCEYTAPHDEL